MGIIEPLKDGFLEIIPEGEDSDYWHIAAIHINGEVFCPSPRIYPSINVAIALWAAPCWSIAKARRIFDWIYNHEIETQGLGCYCEELKITLWRQSKLHPNQRQI